MKGLAKEFSKKTDQEKNSSGKSFLE